MAIKSKILRILAHSEGRTYEEIATMADDLTLSVDTLYQLKDLKLVTFDGDLWAITITGYVVMREEPYHRVCKLAKAGPLQHTGSGVYKGEDLKIKIGREGAYDFLDSPSRYGERLEPLIHHAPP